MKAGKPGSLQKTHRDIIKNRQREFPDQPRMEAHIFIYECTLQHTAQLAPCIVKARLILTLFISAAYGAASGGARAHACTCMLASRWSYIHPAVIIRRIVLRTTRIKYVRWARDLGRRLKCTSCTAAKSESCVMSEEVPQRSS